MSLQLAALLVSFVSASFALEEIVLPNGANALIGQPLNPVSPPKIDPKDWRAANVGIGCIALDGSYKQPGETWDEGGFTQECHIADGHARKDIAGCTDNNGTSRPNGAKWDNGDYVMQCVQHADGWRIPLIACVASDGSYKHAGDTWIFGESAEIGEKRDKTGYIHECQNKSDGSVVEVTVGCSDKNGTRRPNGAKWYNGHYVMQCVKNAEGWSIARVGCVAEDGSSKQPGDTWMEDEFTDIGEKWNKVGFILECQIDSDGDAKKIIAGCTDNNGTRRLNGAKWDNGHYVMQCVINETSWSIALVGCVASDGSYKHPGDTWTERPYIQFGDKWDKVGWTRECQIESDGEVIAVIVGCTDSNGTRRPNGAKWDNGHYVMQCGKNAESWRIVFVGCVASDGSYKQPGDTWTERAFTELGAKWIKVGYARECQIKPDGDVILVTAGCTDNNGTRRPNGAKWDNGDYVMQCVQHADGWRIPLIACVASDGSYKHAGDTWIFGESAEIGEKRDKTGYIHECQNKSDGSVVEVTVGCSDKNGTRRPNGAKWYNGHYVMQCVKNAEGWSIARVGCVAEDGSSKQPGDTWMEDEFTDIGEKWNKVGFILECQIDSDGDAKKIIAGCTDNNGTRRLNGAKWDNGHYVMQCVINETSWSIALVGCVASDGSYKHPGDTWTERPYIQFGDKWDKVGWTRECQIESDGEVIAVIVGCTDSNGTRRPNGAKWDNGHYVMQCGKNAESWRIVFVGCVASDGSYKQPGDTWTERAFTELGAKWIKVGYARECQIKPDGDVILVTAGCTDNNGTRRPNGAKWDNGDYVMQCLQHADGWRIPLIACVASDGSYKHAGDTWIFGESAEIGEKRDKTGYIHECQNKSDGSVVEVTVGCSDKNGTRRPNGEKWNDRNYVRKCVGNANNWRAVAVACIASDGTTKEHEARWGEGAFSHECQIVDGRGNLVITGCIDNNGITRPKGAKWNDRNYVRQCVETAKYWRAASVACIASDGTIKQPRETWNDTTFTKECHIVGDSGLIQLIVGCTDNNGRSRPNGLLVSKRDGENLVVTGTKWDDGNVVTQCVRTWRGSWGTAIVGCVAPDGSYKEPGATWAEGAFSHECQIASQVIAGCVDNNGTVRPTGAKWNDRNYVRQCVEDTEDWRATVVACITSNRTTKEPGAAWNDGGFTKKCQIADGRANQVIVGCTDNNGTSRPSGAKWNDRNYVRQCLKNGEGWRVATVGCIASDGTSKEPGASWGEGAISHECQIVDGRGSHVITRCIDNNGITRPKGAKWDDGSYVIQCIKNGDSWRAMTVGCVASNGSYKENGDKWNDGSFIMQCVSKDSDWGVNRVGCITKRGERKNAGDKWVQGRYIFQCTRFGNSIISKLIGCIEQSGTQHSFGETWSVAPSSPKEYGFVYKCTNSSSGGASIERLACAYNHAGVGFTSIDQGCHKKFSTNDGILYVSCKKTATGAQYGTISGKKPNGEEKAC